MSRNRLVGSRKLVRQDGLATPMALHTRNVATFGFETVPACRGYANREVVRARRGERGSPRNSEWRSAPGRLRVPARASALPVSL